MYTSLHIVIPVYNEAENIKTTLKEIEGKIKIPHTIHIVYDFEEDTTLPVVKKIMQSQGNICLVKNQYGKGALNAIKSGFASIDSGAILVAMADASDDLESVDKMFAKLNEGNDIVCGSRYMKGGKQIGGPWFKKLLSRLAGVSLHYLVGLPTHDVTNSFKMYTKKILNEIKIQSNGGFELEWKLSSKPS